MGGVRNCNVVERAAGVAACERLAAVSSRSSRESEVQVGKGIVLYPWLRICIPEAEEMNLARVVLQDTFPLRIEATDCSTTFSSRRLVDVAENRRSYALAEVTGSRSRVARVERRW